MPLYEFKCTDEKCAKEFEESVKLSEYDTKVIKCPTCEKEAKRKISAGVGPHTTWKHWRL